MSKKTINCVMLRIKSHYDNQKEVKDKDGNVHKLLTDVEDGNNMMVGGRHLKEYTKLCVGEVAMPVSRKITSNKPLPYRAMDGKIPKHSAYQKTYITKLKPGDRVIFRHNVTQGSNNRYEIEGEELWKADFDQIQCILNEDGSISPIGGYILLDKICKDEDIRKLSSDIILMPELGREHKGQSFYGSWGEMIEQSAPLEGDKFLRIRKGSFVFFEKRFAETICYKEKEYWLIRPSDVNCYINRSTYEKIKLT